MAGKEAEERQRVATFLKYFALKSAQVIVQSRNGLKVVPCVKNSEDNTHDWFNLAIPDNEHVSIVTKNALNGDAVPSLKKMLCIDINLKFSEGDEFLLETWMLELSSDTNTKFLCPASEVYSRMTTLLKSLLTLSRLQPAYKLARKQTGEPYSLTYRVYCGDPHLERLGTETKSHIVGKLILYMGTMKLAITYRTDLAMEKYRKGKSTEPKTDIMVNSDHFQETYKKDTTEKKGTDLNKPLSTGAFVDKDIIDNLHKTLFSNLPPEPPMSWLLSQVKVTSDDDNTPDMPKQLELDEAAGGQSSSGGHRSKAIEVPSIKKESLDDNTYHKKLEFPFADGSPITELANFYHECITARSQSDGWCDVAEEMKHLSTDVESMNHQFKAFQDAVPEFDSMIASMFSNSSENTDS